MNSNYTINFSEVSKKFKRGRKLLLKEALLDIFKPGSTEVFWALNNISFNIKKGETVGIIGNNGSGKSTVLKLIAGVTSPDKGVIKVRGKIAPLIELGAGFHPELTGRENVYLSGSILGLTRKELDDRFDKIVDFAELHDFIDTPVKHYSSGMYMRLGFAIAINTKPDILLVDEILAVGDTSFRKKCMNKMEEYKKSGVTTVFVSHNMNSVRDFCTRALYLRGSELVLDDKPRRVIHAYLNNK